MATSFAKKNSALDRLCSKVAGYNEMYPNTNTNSRRSKMWKFITERLVPTGFMKLGAGTAGVELLVAKIGNEEFKDIASFDEFLQKL